MYPLWIAWKCVFLWKIKKCASDSKLLSVSVSLVNRNNSISLLNFFKFNVIGRLQIYSFSVSVDFHSVYHTQKGFCSSFCGSLCASQSMRRYLIISHNTDSHFDKIAWNIFKLNWNASDQNYCRNPLMPQCVVQIERIDDRQLVLTGSQPALHVARQ